MPDSSGRFRGISVPNLPWEKDEPKSEPPRGDQSCFNHDCSWHASLEARMEMLELLNPEEDA